MARRINLLPPSERARTATNVGMLVLVASGVLVVAILGLSWFLLSSSRSDLQAELAARQADRIRLEQEVQALDTYKALVLQRQNLEEVVRQVYAGRTSVSDFMSDLSLVLPENVWLGGMNLTTADPASGFTAAGSFSMTGNTYSFPDVALLLVRLRLVDALQQVTLAQAGPGQGTVDPEKTRGFSITAVIINTQSADTALPVSKVVEGL
jgi:Tfp pilus assembly protein PilN